MYEEMEVLNVYKCICDKCVKPQCYMSVQLNRAGNPLEAVHLTPVKNRLGGKDRN